MVFAFNTVSLITEVKKRPALYEPGHKSYKTERLELWKQVGAALTPNWVSLSKAEVYDNVLQLQRRWRSLRDAYNRELRSRRTGIRVNKRVYVYFKRMSFLGGFEGNIEEEEGDENEDADETNHSFMSGNFVSNEDSEVTYEVGQSEDDYSVKKEVVIPVRSMSNDVCEVSYEEHSEEDPLVGQEELKQVKVAQKKRKRFHRSETPHEEIAIPIDNFEESESDSDRMFMLSWVGDLRQLPSPLKMWARAQIAAVMQEAVSCHYNNTQPKKRRRNSDDLL